MRIRTLRASGARLQADVVIGANEWGSDVTVQVSLDRKDPELTAAMKLLTDVLVKRASSLVDRSAWNLALQEAVREQVTTTLATERERLKKNGASEAEERVRIAQNIASRAERELDAIKARNTRLQHRISQLEAAAK